MWAIAQVSDAPGTRELKELSLAIDTPDGMVVVVGCSHPGIENIVQEVSKINPNIHWVMGGFHMVVANDETIAKVSKTLHDTYRVRNIAPGHCTGEPTFAELQKVFGPRYFYAGVGTVIDLTAATPRVATNLDNARRHALPQGTDLAHYSRLAADSHDALPVHLAHAHR